MKSLLKRFCLGLVLFLMATPGALLAAPAIWRVEGDNGTLYVLGTIHRLPEGVDWFTPEVEEILDTSDTLVLETLKSQADDDLLAYLSGTLGLSRRPLRRYLEGDTYLALAERMDALGVPADQLNRYQPWYAAMLIVRLGSEGIGFYTDYGVETVLQIRAEEKDIALLALETLHQQFMFLANLPTETQVVLLEQTLQQSDDFKTRYQELFDAWISGDTVATEKMILEPLKTAPPMYDVLIVKRNSAWLKKFEALLEDGGQHFIAVGTGHLVGDDSVLKMLEEKGYSVTRQ